MLCAFISSRSSVVNTWNLTPATQTKRWFLLVLTDRGQQISSNKKAAEQNHKSGPCLEFMSNCCHQEGHSAVIIPMPRTSLQARYDMVCKYCFYISKVLDYVYIIMTYCYSVVKHVVKYLQICLWAVNVTFCVSLMSLNHRLRYCLFPVTFPMYLKFFFYGC